MPRPIEVDNTKIVLKTADDIAIAQAIVNALGFEAAAELMFGFSIKSMDTVEVINAAVEHFGRDNAKAWLWRSYDYLGGNTPIDASECGDKDLVLQYMGKWRADLSLYDSALQASWDKQLEREDRFWSIWFVAVPISLVVYVTVVLGLTGYLPFPSFSHGQTQPQIQQSK